MTLALPARPHAETHAHPTHDWLRRLHVVFADGATTPVLDEVIAGLKHHFRRLGHEVEPRASEETDIVFTTARFGEPLGWREALLFSGRRRLGISHSPTICTLIHVTPEKLQERLDYFAEILAKEPPDPEDFEFPGLVADAYHTLVEQGRRGGPLMALERLLQAQSKSIRILLAVGQDRLQFAYLFDLVGAYPRIDAGDPEYFYTDLILRLVTSTCAVEITDHKIETPPIARTVWEGLSTPQAMFVASQELGKRRFFTEMIKVTNLVNVPSVSDAIADQYSEGCFVTYEPGLHGLVATITGSARPVDKTHITEDDLAVIIGVRPDGKGAIVQQVEGKRNDKPSSEAVEMKDMDSVLPTITLGHAWAGLAAARVPVARSKLHGHRGVAAYDARVVEFAPLDPPYYHYPVSCATDAQARGIKQAFSRAQTLHDSGDPRQVVFTVLPGHGVVIVEKWVAGKAPLQLIWEYMDAGYLEIENRVPQGPLTFVPNAIGGPRMILRQQ